ICSGTLIGCDVFLTAAHCVCWGDGPECQDPQPDAPLGVYLQHAGVVEVTSRHVHPDYTFPDNDVAVLELARPVTGIVPSPLQAAEVPLGTTATIAGYGRSGGNLEDYGIKQAGDVVTDTCPRDARGPGHICWRYEGEGANTCNGDSGGPLFVAAGGALAVAGITSGGTRFDCLEGDRSYDTDVFTFREFITGAVGGERLGQATCGAQPQVGTDGAAVASQQGELARNQQAALAFDVPAGTSEIRVTLNAVEGSNLDLRVRRGEPPSADEHDCAAVDASSYGVCAIDAPETGEWHAAVDARRAGEYQLTVTVFAGAPVAVADAYSGAADTVLEVAAEGGLLANDAPSVRGPLTAEVVEAPAHGAVEVAADGGFRYTPEAGYTGEDSFTYQAGDGTQTSTAAVALTIAAAGGGDGDEDPSDDDGGCGCRSGGGGPGPLSFLLLLAFLSLRRRSRFRE
ncbi:MAG TPA: trypsin-like serine protease, partial [Kofleriaceae bacterium]|nr:trypsin-like serine protease [Kofleriaceae bacterium]